MDEQPTQPVSAKAQLIQRSKFDFEQAKNQAKEISKRKEDAISTFLKTNERIQGEIRDLLRDRHLISINGHVKQVQLFCRCLHLLEQHTFELQDQHEDFSKMLRFFSAIERESREALTDLEQKLYSSCIVTSSRSKLWTISLLSWTWWVLRWIGWLITRWGGLSFTRSGGLVDRKSVV